MLPLDKENILLLPSETSFFLDRLQHSHYVFICVLYLRFISLKQNFLRLKGLYFDQKTQKNTQFNPMLTKKKWGLQHPQWCLIMLKRRVIGKTLKKNKPVSCKPPLISDPCLEAYPCQIIDPLGAKTSVLINNPLYF